MSEMSNSKNNKIHKLVERYESMLANESSAFFDSYEFEDIADHYIDKGLLGEAMGSMDIAYEQYPFSANFLIRKAQILTILDRTSEAELLLDKAEALEPNNTDLLIARGSILSKNKEHHKALQMFLKAELHAEDPLDVYPFIAYEFQCLGRFQDAIKYLSTFLDQDPQDDISIFNISYCFERLDAYEEASKFFIKLIDSAPYCEMAWYQLGLAYNKMKSYDKAVWALDYALLIDESFTAAYHEKARSLTHLEKTKEAIKTYMLTLAFEEASGYTFLKIGLCYKQIKMHKQSIRYLTKACHEDPQLAEAWMEIGLCMDVQGRLEEGIHYIEKAVNLNPDDVEYAYIQTKAYKNLGLIAEADLGFQKLIEMGCNSPTILMEYANLMHFQNETKDAIHLLKQGVKHNKNHIELISIIAAYLFIDGQLDKALKYLVKAEAIDPNYKESLFESFPQLENNEQFSKLFNQI